jgi:hypothetical protein
MPWSQEAAEALRRAQGQAENNGTLARMRSSFLQDKIDPKEQFYAPPSPPIPQEMKGQLVKQSIERMSEIWLDLAVPAMPFRR